MANNTNNNNEEKKKIYLYTGSGAAGLGLKTIPKILAQHELLISPQLPNHLEDYDVIIFPGGGAKSMLSNLEHQGLESKLKEAISNGLGYVGICAGAYLGSSKTDCPRFPRGLGLLNVECSCSGHGKTKKGGTKLHLTHGPRLEDSQIAAEGDFEVVAYFASEMGNEPTVLSTFNKPAIIEGDP